MHTAQKGHGEKLSRKRDAAILALLTYPTIEEAAQACGVVKMTLWRWLQEEEFNARFRDAQKQIFDRSLGALQTCTEEAVATLRRNLSCGKPEAENRAAVALLDLSIKGTELREMEQRLRTLEASIQQRKG